MINDRDSNCRSVTIATEQEPEWNQKPGEEETDETYRRTTQRRERALWWEYAKKKKNVSLSLKGSAMVALVIESSCLVSVFKTVTFESRLWSSLPN